MAKDAPTEEKMQKRVDRVSDFCDSYDLTISIKKTEVVYQPAPGLTRSPPLQRKVNDCKWYTSSPTLEAHFQESCTLMMQSMPGSPKLVQHLADYVIVFGVDGNQACQGEVG